MGVPQGTILSLMLFNIFYRKLLEQIIQVFEVGCHQRAADTSTSVPSCSKNEVEILGRCLDASRNWMKANMLKLIPEKTAILQVKKPMQVQNHLPLWRRLHSPFKKGTIGFETLKQKKQGFLKEKKQARAIKEAFSLTGSHPTLMHLHSILLTFAEITKCCKGLVFKTLGSIKN